MQYSTGSTEISQGPAKGEKDSVSDCTLSKSSWRPIKVPCPISAVKERGPAFLSHCSRESSTWPIHIFSKTSGNIPSFWKNCSVKLPAPISQQEARWASSLKREHNGHLHGHSF